MHGCDCNKCQVMWCEAFWQHVLAEGGMPTTHASVTAQEALDARRSLDALLQRRPAFWAAPPAGAAPLGSPRRCDAGVGGATAATRGPHSRAARQRAGLPEDPRSVPDFLVNAGSGRHPL
jgi:hypothetical protein